jgi:DNA-binding PadR family transcriptional regulator
MVNQAERRARMSASIPKDLVAASAVPLVLSILGRGESYGYAIIKEVRDLSAGEMEWADGMLYPVLHRLEKQGFITSRWERSECGRRRKYYRLREMGREVLAEQRRNWLTVYSTLQKSWEEAPCST